MTKMTDSSEARAVILNRIGGLEESITEISAEYAGLPRGYRRTGSLDAAACSQMLEHRLEEYDAAVYRAAPEALPQLIAQILTGRSKSRLAIPGDLPPAWLPSGFFFVAGDDLSASELDGLDGLLSACTVAIATTGTLVLQNAPAQGPRKLSLVPDYHLCIVGAGQVVETVPEAFDRLAQTSRLPTTFISGPSATADIEMTRIKGVHGPRFLDVILAS